MKDGGPGGASVGRLHVDDHIMLSHLEELAYRLDIEIRHEAFDEDAALAPGGLCRIRGRNVIIVNKNTPIKDRLKTIRKALVRFDLSRIYVRPALRDFLATPPVE